MNSDLVITGNFLPFPLYNVTLVTNGQGTIALRPPGGSYLSNSVVTATATPAVGWVFAGWSGGTNIGANPLTLTLDGNLSLTGAFAELPVFNQQPISVTNVVGSTVSFSAQTAGTPPLLYQWYFNNVILAGEDNTMLTLTNVALSQAGKYELIATNSYGSATSSIVSLTLTNFNGPTNVVYSPDEGSLRAALNIGGWVSLAFNGTITLTNTIDITNNISLDAENVSVTISGGNLVRLFNVATGVTFSVTNLTLANGSCIVTNSTDETLADGGAIENDGGIVTLVGCTLTNNTAQALVPTNGQAWGGAIFNNGGSVSLFGCRLSNNAVVGGLFNSALVNNYDSAPGGNGLGGAIFNTNGSFTIVNCIINSNSCTSAGLPWDSSLSEGGALFQASGLLAITNSFFSGNLVLGSEGFDYFNVIYPPQPAYGGALAATAGSVLIAGSQFAWNTAQAGSFGSGTSLALGGAVYNTAAINVESTAFYGNRALSGDNGVYSVSDQAAEGGAICNFGIAVVNGCVIYSNLVQGGSASVYQGQVGNGGPGLGGGIFNAGQIATTNCTLALNVATSGSGSAAGNIGPPPAGVNGNAFGGGIFNNSGATLTALNDTIASNICIAQGPGFSGSNGVASGCQVANTNGTLALHNCIIAYGGTNGNAYGPITDEGYNISSDGSANLDSGSSYNFTDPLLLPLANYGGPTLCMALESNSPAIGSADRSDFPPTDQRGFSRPAGIGPDIGAYEYDSAPPNNLVLNLPAGGNQVLLSFAASTSTLYLLQASTNLALWTNLNTNGPFASPTNINQTISQQGFSVRYFRLVQVSVP
jgi:hypothetical protein